MLMQQTLETLRRMRLVAMADAFLAQAQQPDMHGLSFEERFGLLVDQEWTHRQNRRMARFLKNAKLRLPACPEDIDYQQPRGLDRSVLRSLTSCDWIRMRQNVLITGPTGVGKTFLACALANAACRQGYSARYLSGASAPHRTGGGTGGQILSTPSQPVGQNGSSGPRRVGSVYAPGQPGPGSAGGGG